MFCGLLIKTKKEVKHIYLKIIFDVFSSCDAASHMSKKSWKSILKYVRPSTNSFSNTFSLFQLESKSYRTKQCWPYIGYH
jgi:hypothetical protein